MTQTNWQEARKFLTIFQESFLDANRADAWGKHRFHISDAADCTRKIWYRIMLATHPTLAQTWDYQEEPETIDRLMNLAIGHGVHEYIQTALVERLKWCAREDIEVPLALPDLNIKGSVDAIIPTERFFEVCDMLGIERRPAIKGTHFIVDIKTKREDVLVVSKPGQPKKRESSFPSKVLKYPDQKYFVQIQSYMGLIPELYPERYPDVQLGIFLYICKNDGRTLAIAVDKDDNVAPMVKDKARRVQQYITDRVAPPREHTKSEGCCCGFRTENYDGTVEMKYGCPYYKVCWRSF